MNVANPLVIECGEHTVKPPYTLVGSGEANPHVWLNKLNLGLKGCMEAVLASPKCGSKKHFNYAERGDKNCGCKADKNTSL